MYFGMENGITCGLIFPLICFGVMVLCMAGMISGFLKGSRGGWRGIHYPMLRKQRSPRLGSRNQRGASIIPNSEPDRSGHRLKRQGPGSSRALSDWLRSPS